MAGPAGCMLDRSALDTVIAVLRADGYRTVGPVVRDGAVCLAEVFSTDDLPEGMVADQAPGRYRLQDNGDRRLFAWAAGSQPWKRELFPPRRTVWRADAADSVNVAEEPEEGVRLALIGVRPCDLAALDVLDRVLAGGTNPDPSYEERRASSFTVAVECGVPGGTCFCTSLGTGPSADTGFDVCLTEIEGDDGPLYLARAGTDRGGELLARAGPRPTATDAQWSARDRTLAAAGEAMGRILDTEGLPGLLAASYDHPRWAEISSRCLACGNCTTVCPTCFCTSVEDTTDVSGTVRRDRRWASCFELGHSYLHGGPVRASTTARYRQWMTHKLSTWVDQFGTLGCVGCGRCITWCPVGIDITAEVAAIRADRGGGDGEPAGSLQAEGVGR